MKKIKEFISRKENLLFVLILLLAAFLRLQAFATNTFAFTYDVGRDLLAIKDIVTLNKISLIGPTSGLPGVFYGPWYYFILVPFFIIFGGNPAGIDLTIAMFGIATVVLGFYLGKKLGGIFFGLTFAGILAVSPTLVGISSQIWSPNLAPFFILLVLLLFYRIYKKDGMWDYLFLGIALSLGSEFEIIYGLFLSLSGIIALILFKNKSLTIKKLLMLVLGFAIILAPRVLFELRHGFLQTKSLFAFLTAGGNGAAMNLRLDFMFNRFTEAIAYNNQVLGILILVLTILSIVIYFKKTALPMQKLILTSIVIVLTFMSGFALFHHDLWPHYIVGLPVIFIFLVSVALYLFFSNSNQRILYLFIALAIFLINLNPVSLIQNYNKPFVGDASVYRNQLQVLDYVYREANGKQFKYIVYTPPIFDYTYQYLFEWYGKGKYGYLPKQDSELAFFILEPDVQFPKRLTDWLTIREKDGRIVKSQKMPSGIVVQTRLR